VISRRSGIAAFLILGAVVILAAALAPRVPPNRSLIINSQTSADGWAFRILPMWPAIFRLQ
jgi:hypothetical protein